MYLYQKSGNIVLSHNTQRAMADKNRFIFSKKTKVSTKLLFILQLVLLFKLAP